jgi:uncharacterized membrane protein YhfC
MISNQVIFMMALIGLLIVLLPIVVFIILRKKFALKVVPVLVGAAAFILFALVLEQILHAIVLHPGADGSVDLLKYPVLYVCYGVLSAGVFEETARFLSFKLLKKKYKGIGTAVSYGIGHGGIEAILLAGLAMLSNIIVSLMANAGSTLIPAEAVASLAGASPFIFLVTFAERAIALTAQIALSVVVWHAVNAKGKIWLFPVAILIHALIDTPSVLSQVGVLTNLAVIEILTAILAAATLFFAYKIATNTPKEILE